VEFWFVRLAMFDGGYQTSHQMPMRVNIRRYICSEPATSNSRQLFCTDVVILYKSLFTEKKRLQHKKTQQLQA